MSNAYELVGEGGADFSPRETPARPMLVRLYPRTDDQRAACGPGGVASAAILDAGEQLYEYGSVDYYAVYRYRIGHPSYAAPGDRIDWEDAAGSFRAFLREDAAPAEDLYGYRGVHQLVHGGPTGCDEDAGGYAPAGAGAEYSQTTAFGGGVVAWSPVCADRGLTRNAAIQEAVHCLLHYDEYDDDLTGSGDDEHTLGRVVDRETTPLMTYHWDDDVDEFGGRCPSEDDRADGHTQRLTACTKTAVAQTAEAKADKRL